MGWKDAGRAAGARVSRTPGLSTALRRLALAGAVPAAVWRRLPPPAGAFEVPLDRSRSFRYEPAAGDRSARSLYWRGIDGKEPETIRIFALLAADAHTIVDVGAHTGVYTLTALAVNPSARVVAVEAVPRTFDRLVANVALNGWSDRCELVQAAATAEDGTVELHVPDAALPPSARVVGAHYRRASLPTTEVPARRVDSLVEHADLVKIDVEGAEGDVLAGMRRLRNRPVIVVECLPEGPTGAVEAHARDLGYEIAHLRTSGPEVVTRVVPDPARRDRNFLLRPRPDPG